MTRRPLVLLASGTRPDTIKLAPVLLALRAEDDLESRLVVTGQHRAMLNQALRVFRIRPDLNLRSQDGHRSLGEVSARILAGMARAIDQLAPTVVVVQGDTTTTALASLAAHYAGIPVAHVEAGLRSRRLDAPFPEEANRRITGVVASLHLAPTERARANLLDEGVPDTNVVVTGNTVVDALELLRPSIRVPTWFPRSYRRTILATMHRRESWDRGIASICEALAAVARARRDCLVIVPYHENPVVRDRVMTLLGSEPNVLVRPPVSYSQMLGLLSRADLLVTDSGGLQEEAPSFSLPTLVTRTVTERPEAVEAGFAALVGTDRDRIEQAVVDWVDSAEERRQQLLGRPNPFGDGRAAERCSREIRSLAGLPPSA